MQKGKPKQKVRREHRQKKPGAEAAMENQPAFEFGAALPGQKLINKIAVITGGDSGIGRALAILFARHGADVVITHLKSETIDARVTAEIIKDSGQACLLVPGDISNERHCRSVVAATLKEFGQLDILVNNAGVQYKQKSIEDISAAQLKRTFEVNIFPMFYLVKAALPFMRPGASIINTGSVTAYRGSPMLIDYSSTKGAIISFTRSLAASLIDKEIRVNAVAPGPVWTPLIISSMSEKEIGSFGSDSPMGRAGQPGEIAPCYLFLASDESRFMSGQVLHPNGGEIING